MEKFINTIDVFPIIETRRQELGITLEEIGHHLGYTKSGVRKLLRDNRIRVDTLEHLSVILKQDFFRSISDQLRKGKYIPHTEKLMVKEKAMQYKVTEYQEKYIKCLEEKADLANQIKEAAVYINRCEMLLVKNNIPLPNK